MVGVLFILAQVFFSVVLTFLHWNFLHLIIGHLELHLKLCILLLEPLIPILIIWVLSSVLVIFKLAVLAHKLILHLAVILFVVIIHDVLLSALYVDLSGVEALAELDLLFFAHDHFFAVVVLLLVVNVVLSLDDHGSIVGLYNHLARVNALTPVTLDIVSIILSLALIHKASGVS